MTSIITSIMTKASIITSIMTQATIMKPLWHHYDNVMTPLWQDYVTIMTPLWQYYDNNQHIISLLWHPGHYDTIIPIMTECLHPVYRHAQTAVLYLNSGKWWLTYQDVWSLISTNRLAHSYHGKQLVWHVRYHYTHYLFHYKVYDSCPTSIAAALRRSYALRICWWQVWVSLQVVAARIKL